jgi:hypothetical protein
MRLPEKPAGAPRVIWVIFDEWDPELTFAERPARIQMPEVDRLRGGAFLATRALRANFNTDRAMPALTMGMAVADVRPRGASELMILPKGSPELVEWSKQDNVFREARKLGFNTTVVAWALPYCRVLKDDLSDCAWWSGPAPINTVGVTLPNIFLNRLRSLYETPSRSPFGRSLYVQRHIDIYEGIMAKSLELVRRRSSGLTLLHMPVPHSPFFYNAATGRNDLDSTWLLGMFHRQQLGYYDALALVDRSIGELRRAMEQAGTWDSTTLIFSADHPLRTRPALDGHAVSPYVPFIVKMAGAPQPGEYATPFSALLTKKLIVALLSEEVSRADQLPLWLDAHRGEFASN